MLQFEEIGQNSQIQYKGKKLGDPMTAQEIREKTSSLLENTKGKEEYSKVFDKLVKCKLTKEQEKEIYRVFRNIVSLEEAYLFKLHRRVCHFDVNNEEVSEKKICKVLCKINLHRGNDDEFWGNVSESMAEYSLSEKILYNCFLNIPQIEIINGREILIDTLKYLINSKEKMGKLTLFNWMDDKSKLPKENASLYWKEIFKELGRCFLIPSLEMKILLVFAELEKEGTLTLDSVKRAWLARIVIGINQWRIGYPIHHTVEILSTFVKKYPASSWEMLFHKIVLKSHFLNEKHTIDLLDIFGGFCHKNPLYLFVCKKYSDNELSEDLFEQWVEPLRIQPKRKKIESPTMQLQRWKKEHKEWAFKKIENEKSPLTMMLMDFMNGGSIEKIISSPAYQAEYSLYQKTPQAASGAISVIRKYCDFYFTARALLTLSLHGKDVKWIKTEVSALKQPEFTVFAGQRSSLFIGLGASYQSFNHHPKATFVSFTILETEDVSFEGFMKTIELPDGWKNLSLEACYHQVKRAFFPDKVHSYIFLKLFHIWVVLLLMKFTKAKTFAFIDDQIYSHYLNKVLHILCNKKVQIKEKDEVLDFLDKVDIQKRLKAHKEILGVQGMSRPKMRLEES